MGWLAYGLDKQKDKDRFAAFFCKSQAQAIDGQQDLEQKFKALYNAEFTEKLSGPAQGLSMEDARFFDIMSTSTKMRNGHYIIDLPLKNKEMKMPNNVSQVKGFLNKLGTRLKRDTTMHQHYTESMEKLTRQGHTEKILSEEVSREDGKVWYIPHHGVYHPKKPNKLRVVFNCPMGFKGASLNQELLQGPDLTIGLVGVLLRWRREEITVTADIEAMFYQVRVNKKGL